MKKRAVIIWVLLVIGILAFSVTEFILIPNKERKEAEYKLEQQDALTHDFKNVIKYKNKYMGDSSNIINLNYSLPLNNIPRTNEIDSKNLEYIINYKEEYKNMDEDKVKAALIYNATANFILIDNLEGITFNFTDKSFKVSRNYIKAWYNDGLSSLLEESKWKKEVQEKLTDKNYVKKFWE